MTGPHAERIRVLEAQLKDADKAHAKTLFEFHEMKARAETAEKELFAVKDAASKADADPVAWQNRYRWRSGPSEEWSEWSEWRDGKQPELRTKAEDGSCYDTEERPLYTRPDPEEIAALKADVSLEARAEAAEKREADARAALEANPVGEIAVSELPDDIVDEAAKLAREASPAAIARAILTERNRAEAAENRVKELRDEFSRFMVKACNERDTWKARAEVVEAELELALQRMSDMESSGDDISHDNESESSARDGWEQVDRAEAAEKRVEELEARIRVMERDHGINLSLAASRAEAAEERVAVLEHSLAIADRRVQQLLEAQP